MWRPSHNQPHRTYSKESSENTWKKIEREVEEILEEDQSGFRRGKGNRHATGLLRILQERALNIDEELCACFIELQKAFDRVKWTKLMKIIKGTGINLRKKFGQQIVHESESLTNTVHGETRRVKDGRTVRQGCCLSPILFNLYSECLTMESLEGFGHFKREVQVSTLRNRQITLYCCLRKKRCYRA